MGERSTRGDQRQLEKDDLRVMSSQDEAWRWAVAQYLQSLRSAGLETLPRSELSEQEIALWLGAAGSRANVPAASPLNSISESATNPANPAPTRRSQSVVEPKPTATRQTPRAASGLATGSSQTPYGPPLDLAARRDVLSQLEAEVCRCELCPMLASKRRSTVFGEGALAPRVCFFGEAPGEEEDRQGRPFVGPAGQLLDKMIAACGFQRADVYILNTLKCRPPENRTPTETETENCAPFWQQQLEVLQPEYLVCLGASAIRAILGPGLSVGKLRGRFFEYRSSKVVATYHPSYLLRTEEAKKLAWADLKMMLADMGIQPPKR